MEEVKNMEHNTLNEKLNISDADSTFFDKLKIKLNNDYWYYVNISVGCSDAESEKYVDRAEEILNILEWCDKNYK